MAEVCLGALVLLAVAVWVLSLWVVRLKRRNAILRNENAHGSYGASSKVEAVFEDAFANEYEKVIRLLREGKSTQETSRALKLPLDKVELIVKIERIREKKNT